MLQRSWTLTAVIAVLNAGCASDEDPIAGIASGGSAGNGVGGTGGTGGRSTAETAAGGLAGSSSTLSRTFRCSDAQRTIFDCDANELFGYASVPTFDLSLPTLAWETLKNHALDEQYTEAEATFEGSKVGTVGLRFKVGHGTLEKCFDANKQLTCSKLSMKLKFSEYSTDLRFFGLKRINLNALRWDPSQLHDRIAYRVFREMGIEAPRSSWANVRVNGENIGLYAMVEQVDGRFTSDRWPNEGDGNLYKEVMFSFEDAAYFADLTDASQRSAYKDAIMRLRSDEYFTDRLRTNKDLANHDLLRAFSQDLNSADSNTRRAVLGKYMDIDYLTRYMAVEDALYDGNGIMGVYTAPDYTWTQSSNFFLYEETSQARFWLIPWDLDAALSPGNGFGLVPHWTQKPDDCTKLYPVYGGQSYVLAPGCSPLFQALASDMTAYKLAARALLDGPFAEQRLLEQIAADSALVEAAVTADPSGPGLQSWRSSVEQLKRDVPTLRSRLEQIATAKAPVSLSFSTVKKTDFESLANTDVLFGPRLTTNANSTAQQSLNLIDPLWGSKDLKISFEYRDEVTKAWDQWMYFSVPLTEGSIDARPLTGIRLRVRSDRQRNLRLEVESPAQTRAELGIRQGWDVAAGPTPQQVEVTFAAAAVPSWSISQGTDPHDSLDAVLSKIRGLVFHPYCLGRSSSGFLPAGTSDRGWVQLDDVEFY